MRSQQRQKRRVEVEVGRFGQRKAKEDVQEKPKRMGIGSLGGEGHK